MNNKTKDLEKMALGLTGMFGIYWIYSLFFSKHLPVSDSLKTILGLFLLYGIGLGLLLFITRKISVQSFEKKETPLQNNFFMFFTAIYCHHSFQYDYEHTGSGRYLFHVANAVRYNRTDFISGK